MKKIPTESIDAIITDPPYCSGGFTESQKRQAKKQGIQIDSGNYKRLGWFVNDNMTTSGYIWLMRQVAVQASRILKDGSSLLMFCDWRMYPHLAPALESGGLRHRSLIVWDKGSPGLGWGFKPQYELIVEMAKGKPKYQSLKGRNLITSRRVNPKKRVHPTEKPLDLMEELIKVVVPEDGTVLDAFAGSGSTLVAAHNLGRRYIGIEKDSRFIDVVKGRLEQEGFVH